MHAWCWICSIPLQKEWNGALNCKNIEDILRNYAHEDWIALTDTSNERWKCVLWYIVNVYCSSLIEHSVTLTNINQKYTNAIEQD